MEFVGRSLSQSSGLKTDSTVVAHFAGIATTHPRATTTTGQVRIASALPGRPGHRLARSPITSGRDHDHWLSENGRGCGQASAASARFSLRAFWNSNRIGRIEMNTIRMRAISMFSLTKLIWPKK